MVHRDLKPANVMITPSGRVKVLDFGLAKMLEESDPLATLTVDGAVLGTLAYMSPEQLQGKAADIRSDIFAFGAVLYEMLSGQRAFATAVSREEPATLAGVSFDLTRVVSRCLRKDPGERYARMADVRAALTQSATSTQGAAVEVEPSIAVLPFANMSSDKENEYFSDGLAEEILNALTRVPGLKVTARTSAFAFRGEKQDIRKIGDLLGVSTVLEGSVRRAGNRIRVAVQLVNVNNGYQLWSERYDREMTDVFAVQDEISQSIVETLKVQLAKPGGKAAVGQQTNIEAYQAYLKGRFHLYKLTPDDLARAQKSVEEAIALDPTYAPAHALLSRCLIASTSIAFRPIREAAPLAKAAALKALELNDMDAGVHAQLGALAAQVDFDWKEALRQCQLALSCGPITPEDRALCAIQILAPMRRFEDAIAVIQPAIASDPLAHIPRMALAAALTGLGSYDRAIEELRRVLELQEDLWLANAALGNIYMYQGKAEGAIVVFEKAVRAAPWNSPLIGGLAGSYALAGDRERAEKVLAQLAAAPSPAVRALSYGMYYIACSEFDRAADEWEIAMESRHPLIFNISWSPFFADFRKHPRGRAILAKMNLGDASASGA
jgi:serine/threonine-protein kinase